MALNFLGKVIKMKKLWENKKKTSREVLLEWIPEESWYHVGKHDIIPKEWRALRESEKPNMLEREKLHIMRIKWNSYNRQFVTT